MTSTINYRTYTPTINYISYSGYRTYATCNLQYWHSYINKTRIPGLLDNIVSSAYGSVTGTIFEQFYVGKMWRSPKVVEEMQALVIPHYNEVVADAKKRGRVIDFTVENAPYENKEALFEDVRNTIVTGLQSIKEHRFVGEDAKAETKLDCRFGPYTVAGRLDFSMTRVHFKDFVILDGKGSKHRAKYLDAKPLSSPFSHPKGEQLQLYGALYHEKFKKYIDGLGYLFWKFQGTEAVEWVYWTPDTLEETKQKILGTLHKIDKDATLINTKVGKTRLELVEELFPTKPGFNCKMCNYITVCDDGTKWLAGFEAGERARKREPLPDGDLSLGLSDGVEE